MPNRKLSYEVDVDSTSAVRDLRRLGTEGARAGRELADGFDDAASAGTKALTALGANLDRLEADVEGTARAVKALGQAAGDGFDSARVEGFVADLNRMGVTFDEIEAKAGQFADVMRRADAVKLDAANQGLTTIGRNLDTVRDSGDQSRSVLANLAGNAAQDLGQLGGVVGSLGVGIGQLAEYAVDGNIKLSNLAKVAGPMLALTGALALVNSAAAENAASAQEAEERMTAFREAIEELGPTAAAAAQGLDAMFDTETVAKQPDLLDQVATALGNVKDAVTGIFSANQASGNDPIKILTEAGYTLEVIAAAMAGGEASWNSFMDTISGDDRLNGWGIDFEDMLDKGFGSFQTAADEAAARSAFFATSLGGINDAMRALNNETLSTDEAWNVLLSDLADGTIDAHNASTAWNDLRETLGLTDAEMAALVKQKLDEKLEADAEAARQAAEAHDELAASIGDAVAGMDTAEARSSAFATALDRVAGAASELTQAQEGIGFADNLRTLGDALTELGDAANTVDLVPDDWAEFQNIPDELRPVVDALAGFRDSVQTELAQAFQTGGATGVHQWANQTRQAVEQTMQAAGVEVRTASGEYTEAAQQILSALGLLPDQVVTTVNIAVEQQQLAVLGEVTSALDDLPAAKRAEIELAINGGDPATALQLINDYLLSIGQEPISLEVNATTNAEQVTDELDTAATDRETSIDADTNADQAGGELDTAAADRDTTISANVRQQIIEGLILGAYLDWVARPREARIDTELYGWATAAALLNVLVAGRTAPITVEIPNYWTAEAALDRLARPRFSRIYTTRSSGGMTPQSAEATALTATALEGDAGVAAADVELGAPMAVAAVDGPAGQTVVVDRRPVTVNVTAGVIGSRYDVQRAVRGALADAERLGRR